MTFENPIVHRKAGAYSPQITEETRQLVERLLSYSRGYHGVVNSVGDEDGDQMREALWQVAATVRDLEVADLAVLVLTLGDLLLDVEEVRRFVPQQEESRAMTEAAGELGLALRQGARQYFAREREQQASAGGPVVPPL